MLEKLKAQLGAYRFYWLLIGVLILVAYASAQWSVWRAGLQQVESHSLQTSVDSLLQENLALRKQIAAQDVEKQLAESALQDAQQMLQQLQQQHTKVQTELAFYRKMMAPELQHKGLAIDSFRIKPRVSDRHYEFELVLMQHQRIKTVLKGPIDIELQGSKNGKPVTLKLQSLLLEKEPLRFSFKYFQKIQHSFVLPEGFVPERLMISMEIFKFKRKTGDLFKVWQWPQVFEY